jgi:hypothetical protein
MSDPGARERGRRRITHRLIRQCLLRGSGPEGEPDQDLPLLVLLGPPGSGKTTLLEQVLDSCARSAAVPYAWLDPATTDYRRPWQLAVDLAGSLGATRWREFGSLAFPRLTLGATVVQQRGIDLSNAEGARADVYELLRESRHVERIAHEATVLLRQLIMLLPGPVPDAVRAVLPLAAWALGSRRAVRLLFHTGMTWYGNRGRGPTGDGFGQLVALNRLERQGGPAERQDVDQILCEAFLADLSAAFEGTRHRPCNCVALIDRAEQAVAEDFLATLAAVRAASSAADPGYRCDPLLVVAAADRWLKFGPSWARPWAAVDEEGGSGETAPSPGDVDLGTWREHRLPPTQMDSWWYPVLLGDLAEEEVLRAAAEMRPRELSRLAPFVHRLTDGHAGAAAQVLQLLEGLPETPVEEQLRAVLDLPAPRTGPQEEDPADPVPLGDRLRALLFSLRELRADLVAWSAALDLESALEVWSDDPDRQSVRQLRSELESGLWLVPRAPGKKSTALHPMLRRLLLRELAGRSAADGPDWMQVHQRLRDHHAGRGEPDRAAYHSLAMEHLAPAVDHFNDRFDSAGGTPEEWIGSFQQVASAPNCLPKDGDPHELFDRLVADEAARTVPGPNSERRGWLLHLVAAHWIDADPLLDPERALSRYHLAAGYEWLGGVASHGSHLFHGEAERLRRLGGHA